MCVQWQTHLGMRVRMVLFLPSSGSMSCHTKSRVLFLFILVSEFCNNSLYARFNYLVLHEKFSENGKFLFPHLTRKSIKDFRTKSFSRLNSDSLYIVAIRTDEYRTKWVLDQLGIIPNGYWTKWVLDQMGIDQVGIGPNGYWTKWA